MHYEPEQCYSFINVGEITLVAVHAMNEKGLCVGCSSVRATDAGEVSQDILRNYIFIDQKRA
ncbi:MAG: hypothetical protein QXX56_05560 [Candidatus Bathyarchaeia archaeon]